MSYQQYRPAKFSLLPEVVKNLLIINGIFFLATNVLSNQGVELNDYLGLHYFESDKFRWYQFITYMFMHGNFMHVFFNMLALWMFGQAVENIWGQKKFLTYYILTGLGAAVAQQVVVYFEMQPAITVLNDYIANPDYGKLNSIMQSDIFSRFSSPELGVHIKEFINKFNSMASVDSQQAIESSVEYIKELKADVLNAPVVVGASGAVFGLLLAYGMLFPENVIYIYFVIPLKAKYFVIIYGAIELFSGIASIPGDNIAHFAHLGGLVFGFIIITYWREKNRRRRNDFFNP